MTKKIARYLLADENYNEGLAFVAKAVMKFDNFDDMDNRRCEIYDELIELAYELEDEGYEDDFSSNLLRIDTAIYTAIDNY